MSAIGRMPPELFSAFMAGRHNAQAHEWLRKARDDKRAGRSAALAVGFARKTHHDYLRELAAATRTPIRMDGSRAPAGATSIEWSDLRIAGNDRARGISGTSKLAASGPDANSLQGAYPFDARERAEHWATYCAVQS